MLINFKKIGYSGIILFVYEGKEGIQKYMQYEVYDWPCEKDSSLRKVPNGCRLIKNYKPESRKNMRCALGTYGPIHTKYEVWLGGVCTDDANSDDDA